MKTFIIYILLLLLSFVTNSYSAVYYISLNGNDANNGSYEAPFRTFEKGFSVLQPGDELKVIYGIYTEAVTISSNDGTEGNLLKIVAEDSTRKPVLSGGVTIKDCSYILFKNFEITTKPIEVIGKNTHHNTIANLDVHNVENSYAAWF